MSPSPRYATRSCVGRSDGYEITQFAQIVERPLGPCNQSTLRHDLRIWTSIPNSIVKNLPYDPYLVMGYAPGSLLSSKPRTPALKPTPCFTAFSCDACPVAPSTLMAKSKNCSTPKGDETACLDSGSDRLVAAENYIAILASFATLDVDHHPLLFNVAYFRCVSSARSTPVA
jgi:hypothetical protein